MNMRDESRQNITGNWTTHSIATGSLQRIADATEKMAAGFDAVLKERDYWKREAETYQAMYREQRDRSKRLERTILGLRGQIGRLMKRLKGGAA